MPIIKAENLSKKYTTYKRGGLFKRTAVTVDAVNDISFDIAEREICGILGPNGAGKSTTIKMLCGALFPSGGNIDVMGYSPARDRKRYVREIGAVFGQKSQLIWDIPPVDSFNMNKAIYDIDDREYKSRLDELVTLFEVSEVIEKPTRVLSLGERMKCEFIMAMLHRPKIVFLDEPTIGLDIIAKAKVRSFIREMNKDTTFILTTHDLEDVEQLAHRVMIINYGRKVFDDTFRKLRANLGEKKLVELVMPEPLKQDIKNAKIIDRKSERQITFEVDLSEVSISEFIGQFTFTDISVRELPMEKIIATIYGNQV